MVNFRVIYAILLSIAYLGCVASECVMSDTECTFYLDVREKLTMMKGSVAVFPEKGKLYRYDVTNTSDAEPLDGGDIVQTDGFEPQRLVIVANGTMPGPSIEVYEGQTVTIHVTNNLFNQGLTIHWHGLHQSGTPFMDGVAFITQCPILPGQKFAYKFVAKPKGTFWYHSHMAMQRTMGMFGAFIIHEKAPKVMEEHILQLQDWNHDDSIAVHVKMNVGGFVDRTASSTTDSLDGSHFSRYFMTSGLINGKGRLYDLITRKHNGAPLTVFGVKSGQSYRFRVIAAGHLYPFRVSVDGHELTIVASDGYDIVPKVAESFIINPGERYDFVIQALELVGNYWVRAQTLEAGVDHKAEAILRYEGALDEDPKSVRRDCTTVSPCLVVNCPFSFYPLPNTQCLSFDQLKSLANDPAPAVEDGKFDEHFLNFAFPGLEHYPGQVNGRAFINPTSSALSQREDIKTLCNDDECIEDTTCYCTNDLELTYNNTVQMVFINLGNGKGWNHPVHLHGHSFYVLKMGYAQFNESNGRLIGDNIDIDCGNTTNNFCNYAKWTNSSWTGGNIPGLELDNPPRKDTIIVPTGGYVVLRIRANNPGVWFLHCHIEMHNGDGMAMMISEAKEHIPKVPKHFPTCSEFGTEVIYEDPVNDTGPLNSLSPDMYDSKIFWTVVGLLIGLCAFLLLIIICMCLRRSEGSGREKYDLSQERSAPVHDNKAYQHS